MTRTISRWLDQVELQLFCIEHELNPSDISAAEGAHRAYLILFPDEVDWLEENGIKLSSIRVAPNKYATDPTQCGLLHLTFRRVNDAVMFKLRFG